MIYIKNTEIEIIDIGSSPVNRIDVGYDQVWPSGYYYTLTFKQTNYSSSDKLLSSGINFATFTCYYRKYRSSNNSLVSTEEVTAIPTAPSYCIVYNTTKLYFDYNTYYNTQVSADSSVSVTLSYNGLTATGTVARQGNTYSDSTTITPITISSTPVDASGGSLTYTGGDYTTTRTWTSTYSATQSTGSATFNSPAQNSAVSTVYAYATSYTKTVMIPSLTNNQTGASSYTFVSDSYNGTTVSMTVYQSANYMHQSSTYQMWDPDNNAAYSQSGINIPASPAGYIKFQVRQVTETTWDSGYPGSISTNTVYHTDYTYQAIAYSNGGCITSIGWWDSQYTLQANYSANTGSTMRISGIICTSQNPSFTLGLTVNQPAP